MKYDKLNDMGDKWQKSASFNHVSDRRYMFMTVVGIRSHSL